jgi:RNA polymerase sigma-70 factor (ECF subfamily)
MMGHTGAEQLDALYRRFGPAINRRARSMLRDDQEALDVTQDTFLAYMHGESSLRGKASPFTVLYQIATHKAVDRLRRNARWSGVIGSLDVPEDDAPARPAEWANAHEGGMAQVEAMRDLALLTAGEKPEALTVAILYFVEGYTMEEIGEVLDLDRKEVSRLLRELAERARKRSAQLKPGGTS